MADNVLVDNGGLTDYTTSTDEGAGGHVQRVKLAYSADGSETHIAADADGLLVNLGANNDITGTVTANLAAGTNNIGDVDVLSIAAGDNNIGNVDIVTMPATFAEDAAHTTGDLGIPAHTIRRDTPAASAGSSGDYQPATTDALGKLWVTQTREVRVTATPTISAAVYAAGDLFGTVMTFSGVAEANGGSGRIVGANITNRDTEFPVLELWLFRASPTMVNADNGVFDITDANLEAAELIGVIELSAYYTAANNNVATGSQRGMPLGGNPLHYVCGASSTSIYGVMCVRNAPTPASTSDVVVTLYCELE